MRKLPLLFCLSLLVVLPLLADEAPRFGYPDLAAEPNFRNAAPQQYEWDELTAFLDQWQIPTMDESLSVDSNSTIRRLESVYRIQTIQLEQLRRQARPVISLSADPANPLYGFSLVTAPNPGTGLAQETLTHRFGIGLGLSQLLPTAGSVDLSLKHGMTISSIDGGAWTYKQLPSLSVSLRQPFGLGNAWLDTAYGNRKEERQLLVQEGASDAVSQTEAQLGLQVLQLRGTLQALLESRWLATRQAQLSDDALDDARKNLELGLISRNQLILQENALSQQLLQLASLEREIISVQNALESLSETEIPDGGFGTDMIDPAAITLLERYGAGLLLADPTYEQKALQLDAEYRKAERDLRIAQLDRQMGNPADAPTFALSMNVSPYYAATAGNGLPGSFDELFNSSDPVLSVSLSFQSSDLSRSTSKTTRALADEQIVQASLAMDSAASAVRQKARDLQQRIDSALATLGLLMTEYRFSVNAIEIERILAASYQGNTLSIERKELAMYGAAFAVLQHLRSITVLAAELELYLGATDV